MDPGDAQTEMCDLATNVALDCSRAAARTGLLDMSTGLRMVDMSSRPVRAAAREQSRATFVARSHISVCASPGSIAGILDGQQQPGARRLEGVGVARWPVGVVEDHAAIVCPARPCGQSPDRR